MYTAIMELTDKVSNRLQLPYSKRLTEINAAGMANSKIGRVGTLFPLQRHWKTVTCARGLPFTSPTKFVHMPTNLSISIPAVLALLTATSSISCSRRLYSQPPVEQHRQLLSTSARLPRLTHSC